MGVTELAGWRAAGYAALMQPNLLVWQKAILHWLQLAPAPWLEQVAIWLSTVGNYSSYVVLAAVVFWLGGTQLALDIWWMAIVSMVTCELTKWLFMTPRPIFFPDVHSSNSQSASGASFPSGHALVAMAVYRSLRVKLTGWPLRWLLWWLPLLIGLSRLYLGVHWPVDVLAGWLAGWWLSRLLQSERRRIAVRRNLRLIAYPGLAALLWLVTVCLPFVADTLFVLHAAVGFFLWLPLSSELRPAQTWRRRLLRLTLAGLGWLMLLSVIQLAPVLKVASPYLEGSSISLMGWFFSRMA